MSLPSRELIERPHTFPCRFVFKSIGPNTQEFVDENRLRVVEIAGADEHVELSYRVSAAGNHGSVTMHVHVVDAEQVRSIYLALSTIEGVRMLL
jgi:putative lipoic acid-binding regulatory protein